MKASVKKVWTLWNYALGAVPHFLTMIWLIGPLLIALFLLLIVFRECLHSVRKIYMSREGNHLQKFGGPVSWPLIGTVMDMIFTDFLEWSERICKRWGDPVRLWKFGHPIILISSYEYAIQLLSNPNFNGKLRDLDMIYRHPGGKGLSTTPGDIHGAKRKKVMPAFSRVTVEASIPVFCEESKRLVQKLKGFVDTGQAFDVVTHAMTCLFRMVARSDFGDSFLAENDESEAKSHMNALHTIARNLSSRILGPYLWQRSDCIYFNLTAEGKETRTARDTINRFAAQAIKKRREYYQANNDDNGQKCYLDVLLEIMDKGEMTFDEVISELNNFCGGAYDTTALTVSWTLVLLALNPLHQQRCYEEISKIFSSHPLLPLAASHTKQMKYLELCLKEALRLFPPAPVFPRSTVTDVQLEDGRVIPGGVDVLIFANLIHRDPKHWVEPDKFVPERHLHNNPAFMPFSLGVRNCIGQVYGMLQAKVVLAYLLSEFEWMPAGGGVLDKLEDVKIAYQGLLYPRDGIHLKIKRRGAT